MNDIAYRRAALRVETKLGFYRHATIYLVVNLLLAIWNFWREPNHLWFQWPLLGWGVGLLAHWLNVFSYRFGGERKERMIQRELERQRSDRPPPT
ncbi:MAG: 2TM domain-containing protein [Verrucomicrobiota bacterium]|nr:2TM domain-containing protein [Verrucomicrobiota bacterium]